MVTVSEKWGQQAFMTPTVSDMYALALLFSVSTPFFVSHVFMKGPAV